MFLSHQQLQHINTLTIPQQATVAIEELATSQNKNTQLLQNKNHNNYNTKTHNNFNTKTHNNYNTKTHNNYNTESQKHTTVNKQEHTTITTILINYNWWVLLNRPISILQHTKIIIHYNQPTQFFFFLDQLWLHLVDGFGGFPSSHQSENQAQRRHLFAL